MTLILARYLINNDELALWQFLELSPPSDVLHQAVVLLRSDPFPHMPWVDVCALAAVDAALQSLCPDDDIRDAAARDQAFKERKAWLEDMAKTLARGCLDEPTFASDIEPDFNDEGPPPLCPQ